MNLFKFQKIIWDFYKKNKRAMLWRETKDPYKIFVSEVMLQQTQVSRVLQKYPEFIRIFPNFNALARASLKKVLRVWQGMGYNRRGLYLKQAAEIIVKKYRGRLPAREEDLEQLPGIGPATAASITAFTFNRPTVFIETNIRSVFIHHFFPRHKKISDAKLLPLVEKAVDIRNPREWYYALMDYGAMLKKKGKNPSRKSAHHTKQSKFEGSNRQLRGMILKTLLLKKRLALTSAILKNLNNLQREGLIKQQGARYYIQ